MSLEVHFTGAGELPLGNVSRRFMTSADRIVSSPAARQVFSDFVHNYAGVPPSYLGQIEALPPLTRTLEGEKELRFENVLVSGYTGLGSLVHVRVDWQHRDQSEKHLVVIGDLATGELAERQVRLVEDTGRHEELVRKLYLEDTNSGGMPLEYWPRITIDHRGATFYPGGDMLEEKVQDLSRLYTAALGSVGLVKPRLHSV